ncbi:MAG TPA: flavin reductase family protein [Bryobacteraceae bacterium]|nr:flavin reductase family protein [Bryobacteraceae bacterium]
MIVDPTSADPREIAKLLTSVVLPRPIAFVSTLSLEGVPNLAPFSYFTVASSTPPVLCFAPIVRRDGTKKDTLLNIEATREFVVNIVSEDIAAKMNVCSGEYPPDVNEFAVSGLTPVASDLVKAPRVRESHVNMECRLLQIVEVSSKPGGGSLVLGEVVRFHVDGDILKGDTVDPGKLRAVGRMGGATYARTTDRFDLERPK